MLTPTEAFIVMQRLLRAMNYLHKRHILHRDIKPENIFLKRRFDLNSSLLGDFGLSVDMKRETLRRDVQVGTPRYLPPEITHGKEESSKEADIWAFGVVCFRLLTNQYPDQNGKANYDLISDDRAVRVVKQCLRPKKEYRPPPDQLLQMDGIKEGLVLDKNDLSIIKGGDKWWRE